MTKIPLRQEITEIRKKVSLYLSVNRFDAAEKLLRSAIADFGSLANLLNLLGVTYHKQSRFPDAIREFNKALSSNSAFIEAGLNLAVTLCDLSRYDEAREVFKRLNQTDLSRKRHSSLVLGRIANQHARNGAAYEESGMLGDAIQEYKKALQLFEKMPDVKLSLAKLYVRVGQIEKAKVEFEQILKLRPGHAEAHTWLGILHYKNGARNHAKQCWELAQQSDPNDNSSRAYLKLSQLWMK